MTAPERESAKVTCGDGWALALDLVRPPEPRAVAVVGHAMMVDRRTLDVMRDGLVSHLARRGIAVVWPDLRGHGRSGPLAGEGGAWSYDDLVEQDAPALIGWARARLPGLPVVAVGHSLFGHVALAHAGRHPEAAADGFALLATNIWAPRWEPSASRRLQKRAAAAAWVGITNLLGYFPAKRLRIGNQDEAAAYVRQMAGWVRSDDWRAGDGFSYRAALAKVRRPVLSIAAAGDRLLCHPEAGRRFIAEVPGSEFAVAGVASGLPADPTHMGLVVDRRCRLAWDRVADFVLARS